MGVKSYNDANRKRFQGDEVKHKKLKESKVTRHSTKQKLHQYITDADDWEDDLYDLDDIENM
jgi:hypothetical protein